MPALDDDMQWRALLAGDESGSASAPSSLKARLYTSLIRKQQESGPLESLDATASAGHGLCVFEQLVQIAPLPPAAKSPFFCQVCHARIMSEHMEHPPIYWPNCPYARFKA